MNYKAIWFCMAAAAVAAAEPLPVSSTEVRLALEGKALQRIVTAPSASPRVTAAAKALADYLGRIAQTRFEVVRGDGAGGIAVGVAGDFVAFGFAAQLDAPEPAHREQYLLRSHTNGLWVVGTTDLAVEHAVWDLLFRLGYRQFFPGAHWEVVPSTKDLRLAIDVKEQPAFYARKIWYGWGNWADQQKDKLAWDSRNRMGSGVEINSGHAYESIMSGHKAEFEKHPEYLCSSNSTKFRISNPGLRKLVVDHALKYFEKTPKAECISMEPSDGGGWECPEEEKGFTNISDRVVTLANEVADALNRRYTNKLVGIYAYYQHSPPPTIRVHSNVVVSVATSFIQGGFTIDELIRGWARQGATIGIRDYYSVVVGHKDRPGGAGASDVRRAMSGVTHVYDAGARFMSAESSDSWGPIGLTHYAASRLLWNPKEDPEGILNDFFEKAFGPAQKPMREYYRLIDHSSRALFTRHLIGSMYRQLEAARQLTKDPGIRSRLDDLTLYTRYVELLWDFRQRASEDRLAGTGAALSFSYRIRSTHMVHSLALWRDLRGWGSVPSDYAWNVPERKKGKPEDELVDQLLAPIEKSTAGEDSLTGPEVKQTGDELAWGDSDGVGEETVKGPRTNPWKSSEPFTDAEMAAFISQGISNNPISTFEPIQFSENLVPAAGRLKLKSGKPMKFDLYTRMAMTYYVWLDTPGTLRFEVTGGQISTNGTPKATLKLYAMEDPMSAVAATAQVPSDEKPHAVELTSAFKGLHRLDILDAGRGVALVWEAGTVLSIPSSGDMQTLLRGHAWELYFYVPRGTKEVGGVADGSGVMLDGGGNVVHEFKFKDRTGYFCVPVPPGQDGKLWKFEKSGGRRLLMTVPPYLARCAEELLLPKEVVEADAPPKEAGP